MRRARLRRSSLNPGLPVQEKEMNSNPVAWFEIYVQDIDRAKRFYESVFQATLQKLHAHFRELSSRHFRPT
jgi:predicted enzyme related to lactoylglutathione lyase